MGCLLSRLVFFWLANYYPIQRTCFLFFLYEGGKLRGRKEQTIKTEDGTTKKEDWQIDGQERLEEEKRGQCSLKLSC